MSTNTTAKQDSSQPELKEEIYDICIIGGGINGAGIANYASSLGLKVLLCEKGDFGGSTSSSSTKLIHGGLRYLEFFEFGLVRKALLERADLEKIAPHIIWPLEFVLISNPKLRNKWLVRAGLFLYDLLAGFKNKYNWAKTLNLLNHDYGKELDCVNIINKFSKKNIVGFSYTDLWVDDARLTILNIMQASKNGACMLKNTALHLARYNQDKNYWQIQLYNIKKQKVFKVNSKLIINSAGPWVNNIIKNCLYLQPQYKLRLVKGSHIVVNKLYEGNHCYVLQNDDRRIVFAIPYEEKYTLIGTTEEEVNYIELDKKPTISNEEKNYLCGIANTYFNSKISNEHIIHTYSGVRPLIFDESSNKSSNTRDYYINTIYSKSNEKLGPLINIYGGKITTYRVLAQDVIKQITRNSKQYFNKIVSNKDVFNIPLPGNVKGLSINKSYLGYIKNKYPWLDKKLQQRYSKTYGSLVDYILKDCESMQDIGHHFGCELYQKEIEYLIKYEYVDCVDDLIWRRTKLGLNLSNIQINLISDFINQYLTESVSYGDIKVNS